MKISIEELRRVIKEEVAVVMVEFGDRSEPSEYRDVEKTLRDMFSGAGGLFKGGVSGIGGGTYEYTEPQVGDVVLGKSGWRYVGRVNLNLKLDPTHSEFSGSEDLIEMLQEVPDALSNGGTKFKFEGFIEPKMSPDGSNFSVEFEVAEEPRPRD